MKQLGKLLKQKRLAKKFGQVDGYNIKTRG